MMASLLSLAMLYFIDYGSIGFSLDCTATPYKCLTNIICPPIGDCFIACNEEQSCLSSTIICPIHGDCNIECDGWQACKELVIDSKYSESGNVNVLCADTTDHCYGIKIYGSVIDTYVDDINLICNGAIQSCMQSEIICPVSGNCLISCNADMSCKHSNITGPTNKNGDLIINCNGERSCLNSYINGKQTHQMHISGCTSIDSCLDLSIYCPPNTNQTANCFIQGNDNIGSLTIYAINGWRDIQIDFSGHFDNNHGGIMYCGTNYEMSCNISWNEWTCFYENDICNNINDMMNWNVFNVTNVSGSTNMITVPMQTIPIVKISNDFENGTMGMLLIAGGLIAIAVLCIVCGIVKQTMSKVKKKATVPKGYEGPKSTTTQTKHVEAIIDGEEPTWEDSNGIIHHQHNQHERKMSSLHDRPKR